MLVTGRRNYEIFGDDLADVLAILLTWSDEAPLIAAWASRYLERDPD